MARLSTKKSEYPPLRIRKAKVSDVLKIRELIGVYANQGLMLPRSLNEIYECLRDYWVCEKEEEVIGCVALHVDWEDLAEIRSLVVTENYQGRRIGKRLLQRCIREAKELGIIRIFALTYVPTFFERNGFQLYPKEKLPRKIWSECIRCHKFPDCDESAVVLDV